MVLLGSVAQLEALAERLDVAAVEGPSMSLAGAIRRALAGAAWRPRTLHLGPHRLDLSRRVAVMGIVNVTPDSFFDGGRYDAPQQAVEHALRLVEEGADLLDVGGDSAGGRARADRRRRGDPAGGAGAAGADPADGHPGGGGHLPGAARRPRRWTPGRRW